MKNMESHPFNAVLEFDMLNIDVVLHTFKSNICPIPLAHPRFHQTVKLHQQVIPTKFRYAKLTWKSISVMSWKPSAIVGTWNLDLKPLNAIFGRIERFSEFIYHRLSVLELFGWKGIQTEGLKARTALLCSQSCKVDIKNMHRIGILFLAAKSM